MDGICVTTTGQIPTGEYEEKTRDSTPLESALAFARMGIRVFPTYGIIGGRCTCGKSDCRSLGKHPIEKGYQTAATNEEKELKGFFEKYPDANLAALTGAESEFFVLDVDPRHNGDETLESLTGRYGPLPDTLAVVTGGGGIHYYFRHPGGMSVPNSAGRIGEGLDIRGEGGHVMLPGSSHELGGRYCLADGVQPEWASIAEPPKWLVELAVGRPDGQKKGPVPEVIPEGRRNDELTRIAGANRRVGLGPEEILRVLRVVNQSKCEPPLPEDELGAIAFGMERYEPAPRVSEEDFHLTDLGNAKRLVGRHGKDLRYCPALGKWLVYDDKRWAVDDSGEVERRMKETVNSIYDEAIGLGEDSNKKSLVRHALNSEYDARIKGSISLARTEPGVPVTVGELDKDPWSLNVLNGTVDLRTGELQPNKREDLITKLAPVEYDPVAGCPNWLSFIRLSTGGNQGLADFIQRAVGYSITGIPTNRVMFVLHGIGRNGKTTLLETLGTMLGDYACLLPSTALMADPRNPNKEAKGEIARLRGQRFVHASEGNEGQRLAEGNVKQLTGGGRITARHLYGEPFDFQAVFKLWFDTNHKPEIRGNDDAIWERIRLIPFKIQIENPEEPEVVRARFQEELPGILAWAVRGCMASQKDGLGVPPEVRQATEDYRDEMDTVAGFLKDSCVIGKDHSEGVTLLHQAYQQWCNANGESPVSQKRFSQQLEQRGHSSYRGREGGKTYRRGLRLLTD